MCGEYEVFAAPLMNEYNKRPVFPGQRECPLMVPLFLHVQSSASTLEWIDHPPSVGGTLPRNTSFIINGGGGAEVFPSHQEKNMF